ncbi:MAG: hypothetical protein ABSA67_11185 [Candidatus Brocadiia bacterium]
MTQSPSPDKVGPLAMANPEADKTADAAPAQEIAQDLDELRTLAARFRHLAPTAGEPVLRAILLKREALLGAIGTGVGRLTQSAKSALAGVTPEDAGAQSAAFARVLREVTAMDRESQAALKKRADEVADEVLKLRAGKKWRQSNPR